MCFVSVSLDRQQAPIGPAPRNALLPLMLAITAYVAPSDPPQQRCSSLNGRRGQCIVALRVSSFWLESRLPNSHCASR